MTTHIEYKGVIVTTSEMVTIDVNTSLIVIKPMSQNLNTPQIESVNVDEDIKSTTVEPSIDPDECVTKLIDNDGSIKSLDKDNPKSVDGCWFSKQPDLYLVDPPKQCAAELVDPHTCWFNKTPEAFRCSSIGSKTKRQGDIIRGDLDIDPKSTINKDDYLCKSQM